MWKTLITLSFLSVFLSLECRDLLKIHFKPDKDLYEVGDECRTKPDNKTGICARISDCTRLATYREKELVTCSYAKTEPIVCCRNDDNGETTKERIKLERISFLKCEKYKKILGRPPNEIVGGQRTNPLEFPHMAAIGWQLQKNSIQWKCGGSLISEKFVLTAAHCTSDKGIAPSVVRLGDQNLVKDDDGGFPEDYKIEKIIIHSMFKLPTVYNDIALLQLNSTVYFHMFIFPGCLWQNNAINHTTVIATGWGRIGYGKETSDELQKVELDIVKNEICTTYFETTRRITNGIIDTQLCVGDSKGGKDTCQGDSGGPIQIKEYYNGKKLYFIIGVTSFGKDCGTSIPSVYTRVSSYIDWIENIVWPNE